MALFFLSGGGRYGNQLVNTYHLLAISIEYELTVYKLNDFYLINKENAWPFINININKKYNWEINVKEKSFFMKYFINNFSKLLIFFFHLIFFLIPNFKSFKFIPLKQYEKFTLAKNIELNIYMQRFIDFCANKKVAFSGYGLRDYNLLSKHKYKITNYMTKNLDGSLVIDELAQISEEFLLVHIRRTDFLKIDFYSKVKFSNLEWINSIIKLAKDKNLNNVVLFSDDSLDISFIRELEIHNIKVIFPEEKYDIHFVKLFYNFIKKSKICSLQRIFIIYFIIFFISRVYFYSYKR